jgi:hypothetical protein
MNSSHNIWQNIQQFKPSSHLFLLLLFEDLTIWSRLTCNLLCSPVGLEFVLSLPQQVPSHLEQSWCIAFSYTAPLYQTLTSFLLNLHLLFAAPQVHPGEE